MALTLSPRLGLPNWSAGADPPSRSAFNSAFSAIETLAAYDDGAAGGTTLPVSGVVNGRFAATINGSYRQLYRRAGGAWYLVGGNHLDETIYNRAAGALPTTGAARVISHPSITNPTATENWDGSAIRSARQAIGDLNSGLPGALHVGDTASAVDLATRGRVYARAAASGERGVVASAYGSAAGNLFTALESGGSAAWYVDATGRMRSTAPVALGASAFVTGVPLSVTPGASDLCAVDAYAASTKPALRVFRAAGDASAIALFEQDKITLGRASWAGASISLLGPAVTIAGTLGVTGATTLAGLTAGATSVTSLTDSGTLGVTGNATVGGTLGVTGTSTLGALNAGATSVSSLAASGDTALSGRLRLPTSQPSGTAAGQVRIRADGTLETYDGTDWHAHFGTAAGAANSTGRKHTWVQTGASLRGDDVYVLISGFSGNGGGSIATVSGGSDLVLNTPGLWTLTAYLFCDSGSDGLNRVKLSWPGGAFAFGADMLDTRTRQITVGATASGNGEAMLNWTGYVNAAAAAAPLRLYCAQRGGSGGAASSQTAYRVAAEYLGG